MKQALAVWIALLLMFLIIMLLVDKLSELAEWIWRRVK